MTGTKVLLILLILIVVVFVVIVVWGHGRNANQPEGLSDQEKFEKFDSQQKHPTWLDTFNGFLAPFSPKLTAKDLQPPLTTFDLGSQSTYQLIISEDKDHKFRQAKFTARPTKACAQVTYRASPDQQNALNELKVQDSNMTNDKDDRDHRFTFTILDRGGKLSVQRVTNSHIIPPVPGDCVVALQQ